jgi:hypothetical protein
LGSSLAGVLAAVPLVVASLLIVVSPCAAASRPHAPDIRPSIVAGDADTGSLEAAEDLPVGVLVGSVAVLVAGAALAAGVGSVLLGRGSFRRDPRDDDDA